MMMMMMSVTDLWMLYFENQWTDCDANWHVYEFMRQGHETLIWGQEVKAQGHTSPK